MPLALAHLLDDPGTRESLTSRHLPAYLERQRWYTSKGKAIDAIELTAVPSPRADMGLWLAELRFRGGERELRVLALVERDGVAFAPDDARVVCRTDGGTLLDACGEEEFRAMLYEVMAAERAVAHGGATLRGQAGRVCRERPVYERSALPAQNSSNTVLTYGADGFFKLFRKTEAGVHPDAELIGYLSGQRDFASVPAFGGALEYVGPDGGEPITLGLMLGRVDHRGEAWEVIQHEMSSYAGAYQSSSSLRGIDIAADLDKPLTVTDLPPELAAAMGERACARLELLGRRTAEMHLHLGAAQGDGLTAVDLGADYWDEAKAGLLARLRTEAAYADEALRPALEQLVGYLEATVLPRVARGRIRVHGDYHLGQVLDTAGDVVIIDFEGEPLHDLAYRRRRHPAHKDVAGMVRSLHYAPFAYALQEADGAEWAMRAARNWYHAASRIFLTSYYARAGRAAFLPGARAERAALLAFFLADKALYELAYERASRPTWVSIPRTGILGVAEMLEAR